MTWTRPLRVGDSFITSMDDVANLQGIMPIELVYVQRVCLFLGITTKADISTSDRQDLCKWALTGVSENPRQPVFRFPPPRKSKSSKSNSIIAPSICYTQEKTSDT
jgi:hypothetical protein